MAGYRRLGFDAELPIVEAVDQTAERLGYTRDQLVAHAVKRYLESIGVVWWKSMLEINLPAE